MRKVSVYKCPHCGMRFKTLAGWGEHIERHHPDTIPDGYSYARYFYYIDTGKTHGSCVQCHKPTEWNETTGKYSRYCSDPNCKKKYCAEAKKRMVDKYGVPHLLNDPDQQRKMLASKSKPYKFRDGGSVLYLSSYEKDFLMTCEFVLGLKSKDIMGPSPHTYTYMYEGKQHFYIPDFYIPDLNLEIEIKDGGDNESHATHIVEYDRKTEKVKDEVMIKNPKINYFKVVNKEYQDFYRFLLECKLAIDDDMVKRVELELLPATEAVSAKAINELETPQDVYDFIKKNVSYTEFDKLMTPGEVLQKGKGSCHDQAQLAKELLGKIGKNVALHFFIALRPNDPVGGNTHTFVTYKEDNKIVWFETSWDGANGIRKYDSMNQLKSDLFKYHMKTSYGKKYPELEFEFVGNKVKPGMDLGEYVNAIMGEVATESAFINHKDEYFNIEKWQRKKGQNILYITGLSGSGKSTLGYNLALQHKAIYIELDRVFSNFNMAPKWSMNGPDETEKLFAELYKRFPIDANRDDLKYKGIVRDIRMKRLNWLLDYCNSRPSTLYIWEGIWIFDFFRHEEYYDKPVIILGTSAHTSYIRSLIRDEVIKDSEDAKERKAWYKNNEHNLEIFRKKMRANAEKSPVLESSASSVIWDIFHADAVEEASIFEHIPETVTEAASVPSIKDVTDYAIKSLKSRVPYNMVRYKSYPSTNPMTQSLAIATIDNPDIKRPKSTPYKPVDHDKITNLLKMRGIFPGDPDWKEAYDKAYAYENRHNEQSRQESKKYYEEYDRLMKPLYDGISSSSAELNNKYPGYTLTISQSYIVVRVPSATRESALTSKERTDFGLPDIKKYPMPDAEHVMLAIRFFNYVEPEREEELAQAILQKIDEFDISNINIGENNRFAKYYTPASDSVMTQTFPIEPYCGIIANESAHPKYVHEPIKLTDRLWQSYEGKRYYPLYIGLMKNKSPLGSVIRGWTKENWSHSFISFDPSMTENYTFGNKVIKKGMLNINAFGAGKESFLPKSEFFSYPPSTEYIIYVMFFSEEQIKVVKNTIDNIFAHRDEYQYNVEGLINYIFENPKTDPKKLFCSQFVAMVINSGKKGILDRDPALYSPGSLAHLRGTFYVSDGIIRNYDKLNTEVRTKQIFKNIIETKNMEALEHSTLLYNAEWEGAVDIALEGGYLIS